MQLCQVQSSSNDQQVFLAIQPLQAFATMSDDGVQDVFNSHAISQPDIIACHSSCNLDEDSTQQYLQDLEEVLNSQPDKATVSYNGMDDNLYTFSSLHGNHTQAENALPQDPQWSEGSSTISSSTFFSHPRIASTDVGNALQQDLQWDEGSSTLQDDNLYTSYGNHAQIGDVGNALPQWDEGSNAISSSIFSSHPRTASTHGNHTQAENTLPQDLKNEAKTKLENIIKMHETIEVCTIKCSPRTELSCKTIKKINRINRYISIRANQLIQNLTNTDYKKAFNLNKRLCQGSRNDIKKIMENATAWGLNNGPLEKMKACYEEMIKVTNEILSNHKKKIQQRHVLPQKLQNEVKKELNAIIKNHENIQKELPDYKEILSQHCSTRESFRKINEYISSRATLIIQHLVNPNHKCKFYSDTKCSCQRSRRSIQKVMENATKLELTQLNEPLKKMDTCYERMIVCINKVQLNNHKALKRKRKISND